MLSPRVLVLLAGENNFVVLLKYILEQNDYQTLITSDANEVVSLARANRPRLIIVDSGVETGSIAGSCRQIQKDPGIRHVPVVALVADQEEAETLQQYAARPNACFVKPVSPGDLLEGVHELLRMSDDVHGDDVIKFADIVMNLPAHRVYRNGRRIDLSPTEYRLLRHLLSNPCKVFSREQLLEAVWGRDINVVVRTVDVHVSRLRKALNEHGGNDYLRTVRAAGYAIDPET
jgi:two-component system, OmpR family, phosphate regulon response regulator PhoB